MALLDIDIDLPRRSFALRAALTLDAETVALIGPSGAGKTSLLRSIAGLERPSRGHISLGAECWFDSARKLHLSPERRHVGYLPQDYGLFPHLTVAGNVRFAAKRDRPDLLERLRIAHLASARPRQLSGGERQRVALARALARDPGVLLLDEPFGALDAITREQVRNELGELLSSLHLPSILVTHAFDDATALGNRVGVIDRGRLVQLAAPEDLLRSPATGLVAALTGANVLDGSATPGNAGSVVRLSGGGELTSSQRARGRVSVAVHPWELELTDSATASLTDPVLSIRQDRGAPLLRLARFTLRMPAGVQVSGLPAPGQVVGLRAAPENVRLLEAEPGPSEIP